MPVEPATLAAFALASLIVLAIPGPTIVMVVGQALAHGRSVALASIAGVGLGDLLAAGLSLAGVGVLLSASATAFMVLKWAGAAYLVWIGMRMWRSPTSLSTNDEAADLPRAKRLSARVFRDAFLVTLFNPKGIVFFVAFVPQFLDPGKAYGPQAVVLVAVFVVLGILNALFYVLIAGRARRLVRQKRFLRSLNRLGGTFLIGAGIAAALARRPALS
ncbi:MAG: LysE family translocator [Aurantimonas endophytica]|uniref:LysE family translocator n=1 Tax=Aurantimonas endophytica TaxID=1522175 RepID=UPI0030036511